VKSKRKLELKKIVMKISPVMAKKAQWQIESVMAISIMRK
jgi:hypothetical protein